MVVVINRKGEQNPYNIAKIRNVINHCTEGLSANPIELESKLDTCFTGKVEITTKQIQESLINSALELCDPNFPDWRYVAGRLLMWGITKDIQAERGYSYENYKQSVIEKVKQEKYDEKLLAYTEDELKIAGQWINPKYDLDYDYAGVSLLKRRYLLENELPQEMYLTCALLLAIPEKQSNRLTFAKEIYHAIASRKISLATSILSYLRVPYTSLTSCFNLIIDDNLDNIYDGLKNVARISKTGGGVGVNLSRIRATGSWLMGKPNASSGLTHWIKLFNDTAIAVNQGGRRAGSVTVSLDIWHLDCLNFLEIQTESGDQRLKAYDIFPQLVVVDEFMRRVINNEDWTLVDPYEIKQVVGVDLSKLWGESFEIIYNEFIEPNLGKSIKLYKKVNAKELFIKIMQTITETGLPYIAFKDTINKANPNKHYGYIPSVNLCTESFSNVHSASDLVEMIHCCNLVSLNLANIKDDELPRNCELAVRLLDNTIDLTNPPIKAAADHNLCYRTIGVGVMGLADWLAFKELKYQNLTEISNLFEDISYFCIKTSVELAKERGSYMAFKGSDWHKGLILSKPPNWFKENAKKSERWIELAEDVKQGIRNSQILAIAPNTSSSLIQGCTASVLPVYGRFYYDKNSKGFVPIAPPHIKEKFWFYQENKKLDQKVVVDTISTIQKWIDTGISMELLFDLNKDAYGEGKTLQGKDIYEVLIKAWQQECKTIYYCRFIQKDNFKDKDNDKKTTCTTCAN